MGTSPDHKKGDRSWYLVRHQTPGSQGLFRPHGFEGEKGPLHLLQSLPLKRKNLGSERRDLCPLVLRLVFPSISRDTGGLKPWVKSQQARPDTGPRIAGSQVAGTVLTHKPLCAVQGFH